MMIQHKKNISAFFSIYLFIFLLAFNGSVYGKRTTPRSRVNLYKLHSYFEKSRKEWNIPGMAAAIVKDGKVVLAKGYGLKNFSKEEKVDEQTLFAIASNTKAFTAAALSILKDEGKIRWDDRVRDYLPYFQLYAPYVTEKMTIRDLLCHRCGLKTFSGDLLWYQTSYSTVEVIKRVRYLKPSFGFRSGFGYSNIMFMAAGEIIPAATRNRVSWKDFVKERIFRPLGMNTTNIGTSELKKYSNVATPHYVSLDGKTITIPYTPSDNLAGAGAINSNVMEMARWIIMLLNNGAFNNRQILSEESIWEMWSPHTVLPLSRRYNELFPTTHFRSFGLGWMVFDYHGYKVVTHSGGLDGMISRVALVPEIKLGLVVLTNSINRLPYALMYKVVDTYLGVTPRDWSRIFLERYRESKEREKERIAWIEEKSSKENENPSSVSLEDYAGRYGGPMYGDAKVTPENGKLVLELLPSPVFISDLSHIHHDTFRLKLRKTFSFIPHGLGTVQFLRNKKGQVVEMIIDIPNNDFHFTELEFKKKTASR